MGSINAWTNKGDEPKKVESEDLSHQAVSSYFIGPLCENMPFFRKSINIILDELEKARGDYFPEDGVRPAQDPWVDAARTDATGQRFITANIQNSDRFKECTDRITTSVQKTAELLGKHSLPFWSPRYEAHMCSDVSMPALLGYFTTMLYNPNNVALEASPLTTVAEMEVGLQLCNLFGYNVDENSKEQPMSWGHITCDGSIANLESIWYALL